MHIDLKTKSQVAANKWDLFNNNSVSNFKRLQINANTFERYQNVTLWKKNVKYYMLF